MRIDLDTLGGRYEEQPPPTPPQLGTCCQRSRGSLTPSTAPPRLAIAPLDFNFMLLLFLVIVSHLHLRTTCPVVSPEFPNFTQREASSVPASAGRVSTRRRVSDAFGPGGFSPSRPSVEFQCVNTRRWVPVA